MTTTPPSVSVIMPARNAGRFVESAVRSVLRQTHGAFELIVVDDASSDDTAARVAGFSDDRIKLMRLDVRHGAAAARNHALEVAQAPVVAFMDADDECMPERLALQLGLLRAQPDLDVVGGAILAVDEHGVTLGRRTYPCRHQEIVRRLPIASPLAMPSVMARKAPLLAAGGFDSEWDPVEDYDLWSRLALAGCRFANSPEVLIRYRIHAGAAKVTSLRRQLRLTRAVKAKYWKGRMGLRGSARYAAEGALLLTPPRLVLRAFVATAYRSAAS